MGQLLTKRPPVAEAGCKTTKCIGFGEYGDLDKLHEFDTHLPSMLASDMVMLKVRYATVTRRDLLRLNGSLKHTQPEEIWPCILGYEGCAMVLSAGPDVEGFRMGTEVIFMTDPCRSFFGSLGEYTVVPAKCIAKKPLRTTDSIASALPFDGLTALQVLKKLHVCETDVLVIMDGNDTLGLMCIDLAKNVFNVKEISVIVYSENAKQTCLDKGATQVRVVDSKSKLFEGSLNNETIFDTGHAPTCVVDNLGIPNFIMEHIFDQNASYERRIVTSEGTPTPESLVFAGYPVNLFQHINLYWHKDGQTEKLAESTGIKWEFHVTAYDANEMSELASYCETGSVTPIIHSTYPFHDWKSACNSVKEDNGIGKRVVEFHHKLGDSNTTEKETVSITTV